MKLYEITAVMRSLLDTLSERTLPPDESKDQQGQEQSQQERDLALVAFESATDDMDTKLHSVIAYALELEAEAEARKVVIERMQKANARDIRKAEWLREYAKAAIEAVDLPMPRRFTEFTLNLCKVPRVALVFAPRRVPKEYKSREVVIKIDKAKINADARDGIAIPGVKLQPQTYRLSVK